jgi:hypothetical protein
MKSRFKSKYKNVKTAGYDSKKESKRGKEIALLLKAGVIKEIEEQKVFVLQEKFKARGVKPPHKIGTVRAIKYYADFYYYDCQKQEYVVEDAKGYRTEVYKVKSKMFRLKYPNLLFIES